MTYFWNKTYLPPAPGNWNNSGLDSKRFPKPQQAFACKITASGLSAKEILARWSVLSSLASATILIHLSQTQSWKWDARSSQENIWRPRTYMQKKMTHWNSFQTWERQPSVFTVCHCREARGKLFQKPVNTNKINRQILCRKKKQKIKKRRKTK